jgi:four helix bundle protein
MKDFRELTVWEKSHALALAVYRVSAGFPRHELDGLTSQVRRAASSVPTNVAEGCGREGDPEFARFLQIAMGSASELDYQLLLARDLEYLLPEEYTRLSAAVLEVKRILASLLRKVRAEC